MFKQKLVLPKEWEAELSQIVKKYNLNVKETDMLRFLSHKFYIPPRNAAKTLQLNEIEQALWYESMRKQAITGGERLKKIFAIAVECVDYLHPREVHGEKVYPLKNEYKSLILKLKMKIKRPITVV